MVRDAETNGQPPTLVPSRRVRRYFEYTKYSKTAVPYRTKSSPDLYRNPPSRDSRTREPSWRSCRVERQERGIACLSACEDEKERGLARALQRDGEGNDVRSINYPIRKHSTLEPRTSVPVSPCSHAQLMTLPLARGSWPRNGYECAREGDERGK
jgi:hypothetical protein